MPFHPADINRDFRIVIGEAIAYLASWQQGNSPIGYAVRAAYLWQNGESYVYEPDREPPLCWQVTAFAKGMYAKRAWTL